MKVTFHRKQQDDLGGTTVLACHLRSTDGNTSVRLFGIVRDAWGAIYVEAGGRFVHEFFAREIDALKAPRRKA